MKNILAALAILLLSFNSWAQTLPPILQANKPVRGVYKNFSEFLNDAPSIVSDFEIKPRSKSKQFWLGGSDFDLIIENVKPGVARKFWGVSTGDSILVNVSNYEKNRGYVKLQKLGRFCYSKVRTSSAAQGGAGSAVAMGLIGGAIGGALTTIPYDAAFVLNINNGSFHMLNNEVVTWILEKDEELSAKFEAEGKKRQNDPEVMLSYIDDYNTGHADEIGAKERTRQVVIYRREKKERADTVSVVGTLGQTLEMIPGDFRTLHGKESVTLCISNDCHDFSLSDDVNYIECTFKLNTQKPVLELQERKVGEFYLREIKHAQEEKKE